MKKQLSIILIVAACAMLNIKSVSNSHNIYSKENDLLASSRISIKSMPVNKLWISTSNNYDTVIDNDSASIKWFFEILVKAKYLKEVKLLNLDWDTIPSAINTIASIEKITIDGCCFNTIALNNLKKLIRIDIYKSPPGKLNSFFYQLPANIEEISSVGVIIDSIPDIVLNFRKLKGVELINAGKITYISESFYLIDSLKFFNYGGSTIPYTRDSIKQKFKNNVTVWDL